MSAVSSAISLHYKTLGQGQALIILHGLFGSGSNWLSIAKALANDYQIYLLDLRNHGNSPHDPVMDYMTMANDVANFIQQQNLLKPIILGHSMGGKVAMTLALTQADIAKNFVIVDIAPIQYAHDYDVIFTSLEQLDFSQIKNRQQADKLLQPYLSDRGLRQFLLQNLVNVNGGYQWRIPLNFLCQNMPMILDFPSLKACYNKPIAFIYGEISAYLPESAKPVIADYFPKACYYRIANAGHCLHVEQKTEFLQILTQYLSK